MRFLIFSLSLLFILILPSLHLMAQGISMSPTRLFFYGQPGEILTEKVILSNSSTNDYTFNINKKDWKREDDGNKVYFPQGELKNSNASWVSTVESNIELPAGSTRELTVTMKVPENASTSEVTNSMLFFTQIKRQKDEPEQAKSIGIIALFEFGLHIYYTPVNNNTKSLEILSMTDDQNDSARKATIRLKNDGNVVCDGSVQFELTNKETGKEIKLSPVNISMMPDAEQVISFELPQNLKGNYLGVAIVTMAGTHDLRVGEKNFQFETTAPVAP